MRHGGSADSPAVTCPCTVISVNHASHIPVILYPKAENISAIKLQPSARGNLKADVGFAGARSERLKLDAKLGIIFQSHNRLSNRRKKIEFFNKKIKKTDLTDFSTDSL